jgi:hypothetical protein
MVSLMSLFSFHECLTPPPHVVMPLTPPGLRARPTRYTPGMSFEWPFTPMLPPQLVTGMCEPRIELMSHSITTAASCSNSRFPASHHPNPIKMSSKHRLVDNATYPTISRRPRRFINRSNEFNRSAAAIPRCMA